MKINPIHSYFFTLIICIIAVFAVYDDIARAATAPVAKVTVTQPPKSATAHISCSPLNQLVLTVTPAGK